MKLWGVYWDDEDVESIVLDAICTSEDEAIKICRPDGFIGMFDSDQAMPELFADFEKIYYPHEETWEQSQIYAVRKYGNISNGIH